MLGLEEMLMKIAILATLDTKGEEAAFLHHHFLEAGKQSVVIDTGILESPMMRTDISREAVAKAAGSTLSQIASQGKEVAINHQAVGAGKVLHQLLQEEQICAAIAIGGLQGTIIGTSAMKDLPIGFPKVMVSTVANGDFRFGPFVQDRDIFMVFSVTDILGVNAINHAILTNAANAILGMINTPPIPTHTLSLPIGITSLGITTRGVMAIRNLFKQQGQEVAAFHATGRGGIIMETLVAERKICGVIDLTTYEIPDNLIRKEMPSDRLTVYEAANMPVIFSVGGCSLIGVSRSNPLPHKYRTRKRIAHNSQVFHIQLDPAEMATVAIHMSQLINKASGPTMVIIPAGGFSEHNKVGDILWNPLGIEAMCQAFKSTLRSDIPLLIVEAHINDCRFAKLLVHCMTALLKGVAPAKIDLAGQGLL